jgi:hypothetical protein
MFPKLVSAGLLLTAIAGFAPDASAQVEASTVTDESRPAPSAAAPPPAPAAPLSPPEAPRAHPTMFALGVTATTAGGLAIASGAGIVFMSALDRASCAAPARCGSTDLPGTVGAVLVLSGVVLLATGIPMIVVGGKRARREVAFDPVLLRF